MSGRIPPTQGRQREGGHPDLADDSRIQAAVAAAAAHTDEKQTRAVTLLDIDPKSALYEILPAFSSDKLAVVYVPLATPTKEIHSIAADILIDHLRVHPRDREKKETSPNADASRSTAPREDSQPLHTNSGENQTRAVTLLDIDPKSALYEILPAFSSDKLAVVHVPLATPAKEIYSIAADMLIDHLRVHPRDREKKETSPNAEASRSTAPREDSQPLHTNSGENQTRAVTLLNIDPKSALYEILPAFSSDKLAVVHVPLATPAKEIYSIAADMLIDHLRVHPRDREKKETSPNAEASRSTAPREDSQPLHTNSGENQTRAVTLLNIDPKSALYEILPAFSSDKLAVVHVPLATPAKEIYSIAADMLIDHLRVHPRDREKKETSPDPHQQP